MRSERDVFEQYADLIDRESDPALVGLVRFLDSAKAPEPEHLTASLTRATEERRASGQVASSHVPSPLGASSPSAMPDTHAGIGPARRAPGRGLVGRALSGAWPAAYVAMVAAVVFGLSALLPGMRPTEAPGPVRRGEVASTGEARGSRNLRGADLAAGMRAADRALVRSPATSYLVYERKGERQNVSRTVDGFTVVIGRAYSEAGRLIVSYAIRGPEGHAFDGFRTVAASGQRDGRPRRLGPPVLTDEFGGRWVRARDRWSVGVEQGWAGYADVYEWDVNKWLSRRIKPERLELRWELAGVEEIGRVRGGGVRTAGACKGRRGGACVVPERGSFRLALSVPVDFIHPDFTGRDYLLRVVHAFLDVRQLYLEAPVGSGEAQVYEREARSYLTADLSAAIGDLRAMDLPNKRSWDQPGARDTASDGWRQRRLRGAAGSVECGWLTRVGWASGAGPLWRRLELELVDGAWKVDRVRRAADSPESARTFEETMDGTPPQQP